MLTTLRRAGLMLTATIAFAGAERLPAQAPGVGQAGVARLLEPGLLPLDTQPRPHAIVYGDFYYTRLKIHRIGSYTMLPLFAAEYALGDRLLREVDPPQWIRGVHGTVAGGLGVLFGVNTATGLWNLWDSRHEQVNRTRKYLHAGLLLASDAGMALAGSTAGDARERLSGANHHRDVAVGSMGVAAVGTVMMWLWK